MSETMTLERLMAIVNERAAADPQESYTAKMMTKGPARIAKKLGEEGVEAALAVAVGTPDEVASEAADVLYHLCLGLRVRNVALGDVMDALARRTGQSGLDEKASRKPV